MTHHPFKPYHINAMPDDLMGNHGIGRYILLPGSNGRAEEISKYFDNLIIKHHPRGHHLYLGSLHHEGQTIDVATIPSGMGCPSMEIILHELFHLGAKRFLRVGTAGSLQPHVKVGDIVQAQASVRDEQTTMDYAPLSVPAIASIDMITAVHEAAKKRCSHQPVHTGVVHCKSSFYAREFGAGPQGKENEAFMNLLTQCGVLATEMETSALFIQSQQYHHQLRIKGNGAENQVIWGAILAIIASLDPPVFWSGEQSRTLIKNMIEIALESLMVLAKHDLA